MPQPVEAPLLQLCSANQSAALVECQIAVSCQLCTELHETVVSWATASFEVR
jgi:hypothetical protein